MAAGDETGWRPATRSSPVRRPRPRQRGGLERQGRDDDEREETHFIQLLSTRTYTVIHCQFPLRRGYSHSLPREGHGSSASPPCSVPTLLKAANRDACTPSYMRVVGPAGAQALPEASQPSSTAWGLQKKFVGVKQKKSFPPPQSRDERPDDSVSTGGMVVGDSEGDTCLYLPHLVRPAEGNGELRHVLLPPATAQPDSAQHLLHAVEAWEWKTAQVGIWVFCRFVVMLPASLSYCCEVCQRVKAWHLAGVENLGMASPQRPKSYSREVSVRPVGKV